MLFLEKKINKKLFNKINFVSWQVNRKRIRSEYAHDAANQKIALFHAMIPDRSLITALRS